jgi:hypothetical protein
MESITITSMVPLRTRISAISNACSPVSGGEIRHVPDGPRGPADVIPQQVGDAGCQRGEDIRREGACGPGKHRAEPLTYMGHRVHLLD